jgi:hypothetical protein
VEEKLTGAVEVEHVQVLRPAAPLDVVLALTVERILRDAIAAVIICTFVLAKQVLWYDTSTSESRGKLASEGRGEKSVLVVHEVGTEREGKARAGRY